MTHEEEQQFLNHLDKKLWVAADKLRSTLDAAQYKHTVLGLIFLKYVSDAFDIRHKELDTQFRDPDHEYYMDPEDFGGEGEEYEKDVAYELEVRDYYLETNTFWVPSVARWVFLQNQNKVVINGTIWITPEGDVLLEAPADEEQKRKCKRISSVGQLIDNALESIEVANPKLKGVLNKLYTRLQIDRAKLGELIDLIATIPFNHASLNSKDILGHVYEYMLGQFALAEGKKGGQFYTPKSIVSLIVQMLEPFKGRVYDPAMGSGGFFVQSEHFISAHQGRIEDVSIYGQEYNHTTWQLAAMNMAIRGIDFNFGKEPANTYTNDQHPDLRADFVMANPPFNMKEWDAGVATNDPRWQYGTPPSGNANFAWLQHMLYHLAPNGSLGLLLANGSMSSNTNNEGSIRRALIENDLVECMVALPGQLFTNTQIPACIWFLTRNKGKRTSAAGRKFRDRKGKVLFIDARNLGYMKDRVLRDFTQDDLNQVTEVFHNWQIGKGYEDEAGFCASVDLAAIEKHDYVLTPGRYVGAAAEEDDGEPFAEKMARLTSQLKTQFEESDRLEAEIKKNLTGLGYGI
ncbi:type I restriction-modification system subunit M [Marinibactrum halimedae]|uniref:site-specific DNA-methyltransferase (adenine-specific) n=1 Tax=Marinibactrum halimedae TaxID=1444977 RepID=A0AA37T7Q4_9GAMM|nr:type I restriction-modification system subunit M [Marinibactrum halimedae]MCD9458541.1 type I restriction-modification system subunit M [Marinibactrum halimedae]GLS26593.1 site-specific DNA-methyltransferase type I modification [Marinibactrum halimedae]